MLIDFHAHCKIICDSYQKYTGTLLCSVSKDSDYYQIIEYSDFVLVSHGVEDDPIFNYGNKKALALFEMSFDVFTRLPSRHSAEMPERGERERLLRDVSDKGFSKNYSGIRVSSSGKRFQIKNAVVWNLEDDSGNYYGQAACFSQWVYV